MGSLLPPYPRADWGAPTVVAVASVAAICEDGWTRSGRAVLAIVGHDDSAIPELIVIVISLYITYLVVRFSFVYLWWAFKHYSSTLSGTRTGALIIFSLRRLHFVVTFWEVVETPFVATGGRRAMGMTYIYI